ncbi:hypothetical protein ACFX1Z_002852 [Malus domestica]
MATMEARPEAKPEPKEIEESSEPLLKYKEVRKLLVMENVKVAPPKAMEMRATKGGRISAAPQSIGVESVDLKPKRFDEGKQTQDVRGSPRLATSTEYRSSH